MNEKPPVLTLKCKPTNRLRVFLYLLISVIIFMGNVIPSEVSAKNTTPFFFYKIPINSPGISAAEDAVTVNAGPDQNLLAGANQVNLAGTMAGASTNGTVNLIVIFGESNASG